MRERAIEDGVRRWCKKKGLPFIKMEPMLYKGIPDRLVVLPGGRVLWLEFKTPEGKVTMHQANYINWLVGADHECYVVTSKDQAIELIEEQLE